MAADRVNFRPCFWHTKEVKPEYRRDRDNRIIRCALLPGGIKNVTYDDVLPDGSLIACHLNWHSKKWIKKHAMPWEHVITDYWAWVSDIIPI